MEHAREAIELLLEAEAEQGLDPVPHNAYVEYVVVGSTEAEVPDILIEAEEELAEAPR